MYNAGKEVQKYFEKQLKEYFPELSLHEGDDEDEDVEEEEDL